MRKRKHKQPSSLEAELKRLGSEKLQKDPQRRSRAQLLAKSLWDKSLMGDENALKMLLDRLPEAAPLPEPEPSTAANDKPVSGGMTSYESVTNAFKALVQAGIIPAEVFASFAFKDYAKDNPDWEDPDKIQ